MLQWIHKGAVKWKLPVNRDKIKVVHFRPSPTTRKSTKDYKYGSNDLEVVC